MAQKKMDDHNARIRNVKASVDCKAPVRAEINRAKKEMQEKGSCAPAARVFLVYYLHARFIIKPVVVVAWSFFDLVGLSSWCSSASWALFCFAPHRALQND